MLCPHFFPIGHTQFTTTVGRCCSVEITYLCHYIEVRLFTTRQLINQIIKGSSTSIGTGQHHHASIDTPCLLFWDIFRQKAELLCIHIALAQCHSKIPLIGNDPIIARLWGQVMRKHNKTKRPELGLYRENHSAVALLIKLKQ